MSFCPSHYGAVLARTAAFLVLSWVCGLAQAAGPISATIVEVGPQEIVLKSGGAWFQAVDSSKTRFWLNCAAASRDQFHPGDAVFVRLRTSTVPTEIREIADKASERWLDNLRQNVVKGTVFSVDSNTVTLLFADTTHMSYRVSPKSKVHLHGAEVMFTDLKEGQVVYVKGRALSTLDLFLVSASDIPLIQQPKGKGAKTRGAKRSPLPPVGTLESLVSGVFPKAGMFDVTYNDITLHVTYTGGTSFSSQGKKVSPSTVQPQMMVKVDYHRDQFGRIIATRVVLLG